MVSSAFNNGSINRRNVLKAAGVGLAVGALGSGIAAGHPKPQRTHRLHSGESVAVGTGSVGTFATTNPRGKLSSVGIHISGDALTAFENGDYTANIPGGGYGAFLDFPAAADESQFTVMGFDYGPSGHEPEGIYTAPHFDIHFHLLPEGQVTSIPFGFGLDYDIPAELMPANNVTAAAVGQPRVAIPMMGEHLVDLTAPEIQHLLDPTLEPVSFTHTHVWGAYDPALLSGSGDGVGQITFMEPMITLAFLQSIDEEVEVPINMPESFLVAGDYPTKYVIKPDHSGGVYVSLDDFQEFPAYSA